MKHDDLKQRYESDALKLGEDLSYKQFNLRSVKAYKDPEDIRQKANKNGLVFDHSANAIIVPVCHPDGSVDYAPFHVRMIKNSSVTVDKSVTYLRINFHNPTSMAASKDVQVPLLTERSMLFIKELTMKSENGKNLHVVHNQIKEALKLIKQKDSQQLQSADAKEEDSHLANEKLILTR